MDLLKFKEKKCACVCCLTVHQNIKKTCLYNFDLLKPRLVQLGFTGVYIIFSYFCSIKKKMWVLVRTTKYQNFLYENFHFLVLKFSEYSRLSLSRSPRDSMKHFEISELRHIRFAELRKKNKSNTHISKMNV